MAHDPYCIRCGGVRRWRRRGAGGVASRGVRRLWRRGVGGVWGLAPRGVRPKGGRAGGGGFAAADLILGKRSQFGDKGPEVRSRGWREGGAQVVLRKRSQFGDGAGRVGLKKRTQFGGGRLETGGIGEDCVANKGVVHFPPLVNRRLAGAAVTLKERTRPSCARNGRRIACPTLAIQKVETPEFGLRKRTQLGDTAGVGGGLRRYDACGF